MSYSVFQDDLCASRVFWQEFRHVVCFPMDNDPARLCVIVLGDLAAF